jgi:hypothetical protein
MIGRKYIVFYVCAQLIFQSGFSQTCTYGNIALDDIELYYRPCESSSISQYQPQATSVSSSATKTPEKTTRSCVTDTPGPTTTKLPSPSPTSQTPTPTALFKPHLQNFTIFPTDFMKPSSTKE